MVKQEGKMEGLGRVLIIDDDDNLRATLGMVLKRAGYLVAEAQDAHAALARLEKSRFDMAFLDLRMPGMDGNTLLERLRVEYPEMPVIILTAYASPESSAHAAQFGARDYLVKPVSPANILERVREYLSDAPPGVSMEDLVPSAVQVAAESAQNRGERFLQVGDTLLDKHLNTVAIEEKAYELTAVDAAYLGVLMAHSPEAVSYMKLVSEAQNLQVEPEEARDIARWHVQALRETIEEHLRRPPRIAPLKNYGYRFTLGSD